MPGASDALQNRWSLLRISDLTNPSEKRIIYYENVIDNSGSSTENGDRNFFFARFLNELRKVNLLLRCVFAVKQPLTVALVERESEANALWTP